MTWGFRHWCLLVLAAAVVAAYFGVLGVVQDVMLRTTAEITERSAAAFAELKSLVQPKVAHLKSGLERLAQQERVKKVFAEEGQATGEALVILALFLLLTPIAALMAFVVLMFLVTAIANVIGPWIASRRVAMFIVAGVCALVIHVERDLWVPHATYIAGIVVRAYFLLKVPGSV